MIDCCDGKIKGNCANYEEKREGVEKHDYKIIEKGKKKNSHPSMESYNFPSNVVENFKNIFYFILMNNRIYYYQSRWFCNKRNLLNLIMTFLFFCINRFSDLFIQRRWKMFCDFSEPSSKACHSERKKKNLFHVYLRIAQWVNWFFI